MECINCYMSSKTKLCKYCSPKLCSKCDLDSLTWEDVTDYDCCNPDIDLCIKHASKCIFPLCNERADDLDRTRKLHHNLCAFHSDAYCSQCGHLKEFQNYMDYQDSIDIFMSILFGDDYTKFRDHSYWFTPDTDSENICGACDECWRSKEYTRSCDYHPQPKYLYLSEIENKNENENKFFSCNY